MQNVHKLSIRVKMLVAMRMSSSVANLIPSAGSFCKSAGIRANKSLTFSTLVETGRSESHDAEIVSIT